MLGARRSLVRGSKLRTVVSWSEEMSDAVTTICEAMGVTKSSFFVLAAGLLACRVVSLVPSPKRSIVFRKIEKVLLEALERGRELL